jgi:hypothetical protein
MENNNLIPAWNELPIIRSQLRLQPKKVEESKGEEKKFEGPFDEIKLFEK